MKETTPAAMPPCFDRWCQRFDDVFTHLAQRREFRHYLGGLLGESERKNLTQMSRNTVGVVYHRLHHFLTSAPWDADKLNERRQDVMQQCSQTRPKKDFTLIIDDSGHRKSGVLTDGVGRQYIGEIGKIDNGIVAVTTHLYDGVRSWPLDIGLYRQAKSLPLGKNDPQFIKKPDLALRLIDRCLKRGNRPKVTVIDSGYGNNTPFLAHLEQRKLTYIAALAKNRCVFWKNPEDVVRKFRLDEVVKTLQPEAFTPVNLQSDKPKTVWVATLKVELSGLVGERILAVILDAPNLETAPDIDYLITNAPADVATKEWMVETYAQRNWVEVFYREVKGWLGFKEYQVREASALYRHWILVFCAYTFIIWHQLTGGFRRRWANRPLTTFVEALEAFRTAISYRFIRWLNENADVFAAYKASLGFIWA